MNSYKPTTLEILITNNKYYSDQIFAEKTSIFNIFSNLLVYKRNKILKFSTDYKYGTKK